MSRCQKFLMFMVAILLLLFIGSSCVQDLLIPAYVNKEAAAWAGVPTKMINPFYSTLWDAKRVGMFIDFKQKLYLVEGGFYKNITDISIAGAEEIGDVIFSPNGLGMILPASMAGVLGAIGGGRYIKRPEEKELEKKLNGDK